MDRFKYFLKSYKYDFEKSFWYSYDFRGCAAKIYRTWTI